MKRLLFAILLFASTTAHAAMQETTWTPDTCSGCQVVYEWDDSVPAEDRTHTFKRHIKRDAAHNGLTDQQAFDAVLDENRRKNKVHGQLLTISNMIENTTQSDGTQTVGFKPGIGFNYSWSGTGASRVLTITVYGYTLTNQQKTSAQNWCNTNLGVGKVVIQ